MASAEARAAAHATLWATTAFARSGVATAARHVATDGAQELGKLRASAMRARRRLVNANEQLYFPAALLAGIFVQRHRLQLLSRGMQFTWTRPTPSTSGGRSRLLTRPTGSPPQKKQNSSRLRSSRRLPSTCRIGSRQWTLRRELCDLNSRRNERSRWRIPRIAPIGSSQVRGKTRRPTARPSSLRHHA